MVALREHCKNWNCREKAHLHSYATLDINLLSGTTGMTHTGQIIIFISPFIIDQVGTVKYF